jgi:LysM repeat protein
MTRKPLVAFCLLALTALTVAPASAAPLRDVSYTVRGGDTLSAIGARCGVAWTTIATANKIANPSRISVGQALTIPGSSGCGAAPAPSNPGGGGGGGGGGVPSAPAPRPGGAGFGYGVQVHASGDDAGRLVELTKGMGFNWVKQQVEWRGYEGSKGAYGFGGLEPLVNAANAQGVNVLLSVVKAPQWARPGNTDMSVEGPPANPGDMADFMGALATHFRGRVKAYEIWNEQNLHYEWGNEPLSAARYVQLLGAVYRAVKAADPGALVISGALTPTGVNDGSRAVDDVVYLSQMYANGLRGVSDGIGAHPSGYNNPATVRAGWSTPDEPQFKGHRSFFFRSTMESYRSVMTRYGDGAKKIWPTEFGWASVENLGAGPAGGYEYAAQNSEGEQAQYLVDAFNLARSWGWVGPMFVWNLNFAPVAGPGNEKAAFGLLRSDWSTRPSYEALRGMPK